MENQRKVSNYIMRSRLDMPLEIPGYTELPGVSRNLSKKLWSKLYINLFEQLDTSIIDSVNLKLSNEIYENRIKNS